MIKFNINMLFGVIDLIVFFIFMRLFLFKPIKRVIDARKELVAKQLKDAEETNAEAEAKLADYEEKIADAEAERDKIIADAKDDAKTEYDKILDRAEAEAKQIKTDAKAQIEADRESAKKEAREEIASLAMQAAEKVVGANISAETDSAIFDEFLNEGSDNDE